MRFARAALLTPLLLVLLLAAAPPAAACSPSGPVGPPEVAIWTPADNATRRVDVGDAGGLLGDCSLGLDHDLEGERFVWLGDDRRVHALDLTTGEEEALPLEPGASGMLSLFDDRLLYYHFSRPPRNASVHVYDFITGESERLAAPSRLDLRSGTTTAGPLVIHVHVDASWLSDRLSIYDAGARAWVVHNASLAELGLGPSARVTVAGEEWIVFEHSAREWWAFHVPTGVAYNTTVPPGAAYFWGVAIDGDHLYTVGRADGQFVLERRALPNGTPERVGTLPMEFLGTVDAGRAVVGDLPLYEGWLDMVRERYLAAPFAALAVAALAAAALRRRR